MAQKGAVHATECRIETNVNFDFEIVLDIYNANKWDRISTGVPWR